MSNRIQYDSLLVHYLARDLHDRLSGGRLRRVSFDSDQRRLAIELTGSMLIWELHPTRGWIREIGSRRGRASAALGWGGREVPVQKRARVLGVSAPTDERLVEIVVDAGGDDLAARLVVELMTNQWNAIALNPAGRVVASVWPREAGGRVIRRGEPYITPWGATFAPSSEAGPEPIPDPDEGRAGGQQPLSLAEWTSLLAPVEPSKRRGALLRGVAWTSAINADAILGDAADSGKGHDPAVLDAAHDRYAALGSRPAPAPRVLLGDGPQPYPLPLPAARDRPTDSLLAAFELAARLARRQKDEAPELQGAAWGELAPEVRDALEARRREAAHRAERLRAQVEAAPGRAAELRRRADLLMSQLHSVEKGATGAELDDFQGGTVVVELDPTLEPHGNARAWYDRARKRERAAERLPPKVKEAEAERDRLDALLRAIDAGEADPSELDRWVREVRPAESGRAGEPEERLPYTVFRSSGGHEIRVGRGARSNDELTFHHSSPDDVWMHARDVAGAHVILRWPRRDQNPPKRDLTEAAILAALHSKARTAGVVPVDWTRRKYVRKPRKAPPGAVLPDQVSTVFVEPDRRVLERLRVGPAEE